jgi:hypothetical protein
MLIAVPEGLSAAEVSKEVSEHAEHTRHDRGWVSALEAAVLSIVTLVAAWSGYSAAKFGTESSLHLAKASATRAKANRAYQESLDVRIGDALVFNAWLGAKARADADLERVTEKRFSPQLRPAFEAWLATDPFTNPNAPAGPQAMPQYHPPGLAESAALDQEATDLYAEGQHAAQTGDDYVRTTVILASVLFLVGIASHFADRRVRLGMIAVGAILLTFAVVEILTLPLPS